MARKRNRNTVTNTNTNDTTGADETVVTTQTDAEIEAAVADIDFSTMSTDDVDLTTIEVTDEQTSADPDTQTEDEDLAAVAAQIEATEVHEAEAVVETEASDDAPKSFKELLDAQTTESVEAMTKEIADALDTRAANEKSKDATNTSIQRTLDSARKKLVMPSVARVLLAANVTTAQFRDVNVYTILKIADVVNGLSRDDTKITNAINVACLKSLIAFETEGLEFNSEMAKASASDKIIVGAAVKKHLVRHTVAKGTAPTQSSSTMQACEILGIVKTAGSKKNTTYRFADTPIAHATKERLAA